MKTFLHDFPKAAILIAVAVLLLIAAGCESTTNDESDTVEWTYTDPTNTTSSSTNSTAQ